MWRGAALPETIARTRRLTPTRVIPAETSGHYTDIRDIRDITPTMFRGWSVDRRDMMVGHILTEIFLIDDDRDEAQDDTEITVGVALLVTV